MIREQDDSHGLSVEIVKDFKKKKLIMSMNTMVLKFIENSLIIKENGYIFILLKIPFMKPIFDAKGIEIKGNGMFKNDLQIKIHGRRRRISI